MSDLIGFLLLVFAVLLTMKRAVVGPQPYFARASVVCLCLGFAGVALHQEEASNELTDVLSLFLIPGMLLMSAMLMTDNWWMMKKLWARWSHKP